MIDMKKYVGVEFINAERCTSEEFKKYAEDHPNEIAASIEAHWHNEPGFMLLIGDKRAWLPAVVFFARFSEVPNNDPATIAQTICNSAIGWSMVHSLIDDNGMQSPQSSEKQGEKIFKFKLAGTALYKNRIMFVNGAMLMNIENSQVKVYTPADSEIKDRPVMKIDYSQWHTKAVDLITGMLYFVANNASGKPNKDNMVGLVIPTRKLEDGFVEVLMLTPDRQVKVANIGNGSYRIFPVELA